MSGGIIPLCGSTGRGPASTTSVAAGTICTVATGEFHISHRSAGGTTRDAGGTVRAYRIASLGHYGARIDEMRITTCGGACTACTNDHRIVGARHDGQYLAGIRAATATAGLRSIIGSRAPSSPTAPTFNGDLGYTERRCPCRVGGIGLGDLCGCTTNKAYEQHAHPCHGRSLGPVQDTPPLFNGAHPSSGTRITVCSFPLHSWVVIG